MAVQPARNHHQFWLKLVIRSRAVCRTIELTGGWFVTASHSPSTQAHAHTRTHTRPRTPTLCWVGGRWLWALVMLRVFVRSANQSSTNCPDTTPSSPPQCIPLHLRISRILPTRHPKRVYHACDERVTRKPHSPTASQVLKQAIVYLGICRPLILHYPASQFHLPHKGHNF